MFTEGWRLACPDKMPAFHGPHGWQNLDGSLSNSITLSWLGFLCEMIYAWPRWRQALRSSLEVFFNLLLTLAFGWWMKAGLGWDGRLSVAQPGSVRWVVQQQRTHSYRFFSVVKKSPRIIYTQQCGQWLISLRELSDNSTQDLLLLLGAWLNLRHLQKCKCKYPCLAPYIYIKHLWSSNSLRFIAWRGKEWRTVRVLSLKVAVC